MTDDRLFMRQTGFYDPSEHRDAQVTMVGCGGIGSFAALAIAKLGIPRMTLIDPDIVELHNAPNQFHAPEHANRSKVATLGDECEYHIGDHIHVDRYQASITEHGWECAGMDSLPPRELEGVVISGLDNMKARQDLWREKIALKPAVKRYIDGRLAGQRILIYTVDPTNIEDVEKYEATLLDDSEIEDAPCTERGLIDVGFQVGALITRQVRKHYNGEDVEPIIHMNQNTLNIMKGDWV